MLCSFVFGDQHFGELSVYLFKIDKGNINVCNS
jgi:hypothetical protein